ncbi:MAG: type IV secretion system protein [Alphaproteobacteria bacterium]|nr:type IV secretion system protein [Alphaproteobacteria bacterium]
MSIGAMQHLKRICAVAFLCVAVWFLFAPVHAAYAVDLNLNLNLNLSPSAAAPSGNGMVAKCEDYDGIAVRIVSCVRDTLANASGVFFEQFTPMLTGAVMGFLTLTVIFYGVMLAGGMVENVARDTMVMLIKLSFVVYFVQNTDMLYEWVIESMDALSASMFSFGTINHPTASACMVGQDTIWQRLDCLMDTTFGIDMGDGGSESSNIQITGVGLARGLFAFFASAFFTSVPGFIIGIIGFGFMYTMLFFLVKVVFVFLMSYIGILFMMLIGPLFIPLVMFRQTKQYFDNWVGLVVSFALQPVIVVTFVSFACAALDVTIFSGDQSFVRTIAGDAARANGFNLNRYIEENEGYKDETVGPTMLAQGSTGETPQGTVREGAVPYFDSECTQSVEAAQNCAEGWVVGVNLRKIDWNKLAHARRPEVQPENETGNGLLDDSETTDPVEKAFMNELMASAILLMVMSFIVNALMKVVPQIANDLVGSFRTTPNVFGLAGGWKWQSAMSGQAGRQMSETLAGRR